MKKRNNNSKEGFTIIEVVLVLAIAGLIFLMVFVALPALQRSQRDTQRRNDMARLITAVQNYQAGNKNKVPTSFTADSTFYTGYLTTNDDTFQDPSTNSNYVFAGTVTCASDSCDNASTKKENAEMGIIVPYTNATCDGANPKYAQGNGKLAFTIKLEGAGTYCTNN
ncbi:type II secretion system protein [Candidatus Saccharibacteria bacterium]|nr:type II secretion system protein [Candidatus Saccharibacteria bacterium]